MIKVTVSFFQYKCIEIQIWIDNGQWHVGAYIDTTWITFSGDYDKVLDSIFNAIDVDHKRYIHS